MNSKRLSNVFLIFAVSFFFMEAASSAEIPVGTIRIALNDVKIVSVDGKERIATVGEPVFKDETIKTGKDSKTKILFSNDNILVLGFDSSLKIDELTYDADTKDSKSIFTLIGGKVRSIVKKLLTPNSQFKIKTANSDIGVLGTDFIVIWNDKSGVLEVFTESGQIKIDSPQNRWNSLNLLENFYTKIEGDAPPSNPRQFGRETYDPVRGELTIYEEINPAPPKDIKDQLDGNKPAGDSSGSESGEGDNLDSGNGGVNTPPIQQEPQTGKVKVKVITNFP